MDDPRITRYASEKFVKEFVNETVTNAGTGSVNLDDYVKKVDGMGLTHNDLTDTLKTKYDGAATHASSTHAPTNAQKNSDITKAEIEAKLTGDISTHTHSSYDVAVTHARSTHAPTNAQKNSDITKAEIEAKLTGNITTHTHDYTSKEYVDSLSMVLGKSSEIIFDDLDTSSLVLTDYEDYAGGTALKFNIKETVDQTNMHYRITVGTQTKEITHVFEPSDFTWHDNYGCWHSHIDDYNEIYFGTNSEGYLMLTYNTMTPVFCYIKIEKIVNKKMSIKEYVDSTFLTSHQSLAGLATETFVNTAVAGIVDSAPAALDTLKELSTALGDDPNFATTVATNIGGKVDKVDGMGLTHNDLTDALKSGYDSAATHANTAHAPSNAQKNSDITKAEIEAKLTGDISTHTHSRYATQADLDAVSKINVESYDEIFDASVNESPLIEASDVSFAGGTAYQLNVDMEFDETEFPYTISVGSDSSTVQHNFSEDDFVYDEEHSCWKASVDEVNEIFVGKNESGKVLITYDTILPTFYYIHIQKVTKQGTMSIRNYVDYKSEEASDNDIIAMLTEVLGGDYSA